MSTVSIVRLKGRTRRSEEDEKRTAAGDSVKPEKRALSCLPVFELCAFEEPQPSIIVSSFERCVEVDGRIRG